MVHYLSGSETTERESLMDTITVRAPYMTPLLRQLPQMTIDRRYIEWSTDVPFSSSDNVRSISNPHINTRRESIDYADITPSYPTRLKAIAEIQHFSFTISNTDKTVVMAGADSTFGYRSGQLFTRLLNSIDNVLMYGRGSPETSGGSTDERMTQGLLSWAAYTGLERCHGTATTLSDPYGTSIPSSMWSVFYDFNHTNITAESFYANIIRRLTNAGADLASSPWIFYGGDYLMTRIARFLITDGGVSINDRNVAASEGGGYDYLHWIQLPNGIKVGFRTNRWLDESSSTWTTDNRDTTPSSPTSEGTINKTFSGDQTLIGYEPGAVSIGWLREPGFERVPTSGDYSRVAAVAEFLLHVKHPLCVGGAGNAMS